MAELISTFIAAEPPKPPTGGGLRTLNFYKALAGMSKCNLFILFPVKTAELPIDVTSASSNIICSQQTFNKRQPGRISSILTDIRFLVAPWSFSRGTVILSADYYLTNRYDGNNFLRAFFLFCLRHSLFFYTGLIYKLGYKMPGKTLERLNQFAELETAIKQSVVSTDILWIDFSSLLPFFGKIRSSNSNLKLICNAHNIEYKLLQRLANISTSKLERHWYKRQAAIMKTAELKGFSDCDLIITCSENDKFEILKDLPNATIEVIPNGVDVDYFVPKSDPTLNPSLLFTGTMGYEPNRDAVEYFIREIFPLVLKVNPACKFIIAGANAAGAFNAYEDNSQIEIISSPFDMRPIYDKAWIVVVPLRSGSGTRLKILEAMAMEKLVISTSIGVEGIAVEHSKHLFIEDEEKKFADRINCLIQDMQSHFSIIESAKEKVIQHYSWQTIRKKATEKIWKIAYR